MLLQNYFAFQIMLKVIFILIIHIDCKDKLTNETENVENFQEIFQPENQTNNMINEEKMSIFEQDNKSDKDDLEKHEDVEETVEGDSWIKEAVLDVAYYLRAHKFNDFDRRYTQEEFVQDEDKYFYAAFPEPPLRHYHWEVHKYCSQSFSSCLKYLHRTILDAYLQRTSDTSIFINSQGWNWEGHKETINIVDAECKRLKDLDTKTAEPFQGPLERFQWRTSASYFMCMYTLQNVSFLSEFGEKCDNFANCWDQSFGASNRDPRADDNKQFACALYSFCPDPCCPMKHVISINQCRLATEYPCWNNSEVMTSRCILRMEQNTDLPSIIYNRWNVTCTCKDLGFTWDSKFGICVDKNECLEGNHTCDEVSELCFNTVGGHECCCKWGYEYDPDSQKCVSSQVLDRIIARIKINRNHPSVIKEVKSEPQSALGLVFSILRFIKDIFII